jgi:hypothetical protein
VSPTVFREGSYRFFFFSREEARAHIHVASSEGEVKFWVDPTVELAVNDGLAEREVRLVARIVERRRDEILSAWRRHFGS